MTTIARSLSEFEQWRSTVDDVAVVLTMGALHEGHASLIQLAKQSEMPVVLTVFVNPTQFGPDEDLARYPRTEGADIDLARRLDVDCIWLPTQPDIYPSDESVEVIEPGPLGEVLEGFIRPGHFAGVLTVVYRFFTLIRPSVAVFGKKDRQQLALIEQMVHERLPSVRVIRAETVREADGLALSSRNRYLNVDERAQALALSRALFAGRHASGQGVTAVLARAEAQLSDLDVDYCVMTDDQLTPVDPDYCGSAVLLVAARIGSTRLIDNIDVEVPCP